MTTLKDLADTYGSLEDGINAVWDGKVDDGQSVLDRLAAHTIRSALVLRAHNLGYSCATAAVADALRNGTGTFAGTDSKLLGLVEQHLPEALVAAAAALNRELAERRSRSGAVSES